MLQILLLFIPRIPILVVAASPWGAARPRHGMPKGDDRQVMLRAFGKPNKSHSNDYEFSFMIRNWYIASQ